MHQPRTLHPSSLFRGIVLLMVLAAVVVACSGGSDDGGGSADPGDSGDDSGLTIEPVDGVEGAELGDVPPSVDGDPAPDVAFDYFDGSSGTLEDLAGRPVVLNFWASWCAPCVAEMPDLEEVFQEVRGEADFVGINVTDERNDADDLVERTGVTYTMAEDPAGEIHRAFRGFAMPTTILIAADGTVTRSHAGPISADQLRDFIAEDFGL